MKSLNGIRMRSSSVMGGNELENCLLVWLLTLCYSPFMYFLAQTLSSEKRKLKEVMKTMGLRDAAFWWAVRWAGVSSCHLKPATSWEKESRNPLLPRALSTELSKPSAVMKLWLKIVILCCFLSNLDIYLSERCCYKVMNVLASPVP